MKKFFIFFALVVLIAAPTWSAYAQPVPVQNSATQSPCGLPQNSLFKPIVCAPWFTSGEQTIGGVVSTAFELSIGFGAVAAVLMLVVGGFEYMTQDAVVAQKEAKARIQGAVLGLILLLLSYLILYVINPEILTSIDCFQAMLEGKTGANCKGPVVQQQTTLTANQLQLPTITTNSAGNTQILTPQSQIRCGATDCNAASTACTTKGGVVINIASSGTTQWVMCSE